MKRLTRLRNNWICGVITVLAFTCFSSAEEAKKPKEAQQQKVKMSEDGTMLEMSGVKVMITEKYVDVDVKVCLTKGLLELLVCAKNTKEHESIFALETKAEMVHTGLLLIGAQPGSPAMRKPIEGKEGQWVDILPSGTEIAVSLVYKDEDGKEVERPINDFIRRANREDTSNAALGENKRKRKPFPTNTFVFAGSHFSETEDGISRYLAEVAGNVISLSTFGDELLCLPGIHGHGNDLLSWEVDDTHLPALGEKVILRLRPKLAEKKPEEK